MNQLDRLCMHKCPVASVLSDSSATPMVCSPDSSVHGILRARILEWVCSPSSRGPSRPRNPSNLPFLQLLLWWLLYFWRHLGSPERLCPYLITSCLPLFFLEACEEFHCICTICPNKLLLKLPIHQKYTQRWNSCVILEQVSLFSKIPSNAEKHIFKRVSSKRRGILTDLLGKMLEQPPNCRK